MSTKCKLYGLAMCPPGACARAFSGVLIRQWLPETCTRLATSRSIQTGGMRAMNPHSFYATQNVAHVLSMHRIFTPSHDYLHTIASHIIAISLESACSSETIAQMRATSSMMISILCCIANNSPAMLSLSRGTAASVLSQLIAYFLGCGFAF